MSREIPVSGVTGMGWFEPENPGLVQQTGSNALDALGVVATQTEQTITFQSLTKSVLLQNDGINDVKVAFNGATPFGTLADEADPTWVFAGTWTASGLKKYGVGSKYSGTAGSTAVYNPANAKVTALTLALVIGNGVGINQVELSLDGTTWLNPSDIVGVTRSDSATGTALNTIDGYVVAGIAYRNTTFYLPYPSTWRMRVTATNTKNASSTNTFVFVDAGFFAAFEVTKLKAGESLDLRIAVTSMALVADSGSPAVRIWGLR